VIALSTAWLGGDHPTFESTVRAAHAAGFTAFEIGVAGKMPAADEIRRLASQLGLTFTSVHNIAYREGLSPNEVRGDGLSSENRETRQRAIAKTVETIQLARAVGARFVVIHAGEVEIADGGDRQEHMRKLVEAGKRGNAAAFMADSLAARNALAPRFVEHAAASITEVFNQAGDFPLAFECRVHYYSIPLPAELDYFRRALPGRPVYYWHDTGHARILEQIGLMPALDWLKRFGDILAGFHFHDVIVMGDHRQPGTGDLDFATFKPYLRAETARVMELHYLTTAAQLLEGRRVLEAAGID
jgi:sugar phosphate isomerase/epimerase